MPKTETEHVATLLNQWFEGNSAFRLTLSGPHAAHDGERCLSHGYFKIGILRGESLEFDFEPIMYRSSETAQDIQKELHRQGWGDSAVTFIHADDGDAVIEILVADDAFADKHQTGKLVGKKKRPQGKRNPFPALYDMQASPPEVSGEIKKLLALRRYQHLGLGKKSGIANGSMTHYKTGSKRLGNSSLKKILPHLESDGDRAALVNAWILDHFEPDIDVEPILETIVLSNLAKSDPTKGRLVKDILG